MPIDEGTDIGLEFSDGGVDTSPDFLSGELREPALDLIDPRCRSRREVDMIMRPAGEPRLDLRGVCTENSNSRILMVKAPENSP